MCSSRLSGSSEKQKFVVFRVIFSQDFLDLLTCELRVHSNFPRKCRATLMIIKEMKPNIFVILTLIATTAHRSQCLEREMTIQVNAKERECFYERVEANFIIDIEYQVSSLPLCKHPKVIVEFFSGD